jgi:arabinosyltransferase C
MDSYDRTVTLVSFEVGGRPPRALVLGTGLCALLAVIFSVLLPLAPVFVNEPTVRWPVDPARPTSTMLTVTAYRPAELDVRFSCRAVRAASAADHIATVVSTINPVLPEAANLGLVVRINDFPEATDSGSGSGSGSSVSGSSGSGSSGSGSGSGSSGSGSGSGSSGSGSSGSGSSGSGSSGSARTQKSLRLTVDAVGSRLLSAQVPTEGDCGYRVHGDARDGMVITRDDVEVGRGPAGVLPDVDMLVTSIGTLPDATTADLGVALRLDDEFATSPSGLKIVLIVLLVLALAGVGVGLWQLDAAVPRVPTRPRLPRPHVADGIVLIAAVVWMLLAPSTDDDGYYAAMATNSRLSGYVGNYYQLYDQSFTPITWFYQVLGWWQSIAGTAPVAQRALSLVIGLATWCAVRTFISSALRHGPQLSENPTPPSVTEPITPAYSRLVTRLAPAVAAVAFLTWWMPSDLGVRPEGAVALLGVLALLGVRLAIRRRRLLAAFGASAAAGFALATHTTGFVGLAPLVVGLGGLWGLARVPGPWRATWHATAARVLAVISGGTTASLAGFADGSLRDFLRAQQIFLDIQPREYWYTEYLRWYFLLGDGAMGNFAKRIAVLVALVGLVWFLTLAASSRARGEPAPATLRLAGWSLIASFGLLWLTPSKWTHHFGALAGVGPVFLTLLLVMAVPLTRRVFAGARIPLPVVACAGGSMVVALMLAGHGHNIWPYGWLTTLGGRAGFGDVAQPPQVGPFAFGSPLCWIVLLGACIATAWVWTSRRGRGGAAATGRAANATAAAHTAVDHTADEAAAERRAERWGVAGLRGVALFVVVGMLANLMYLFGTFALAPRANAEPATPPMDGRCGAADAVSVYDPFNATSLSPTAGLNPEPLPSSAASDEDADSDDPSIASGSGVDSGSGSGPASAANRQSRSGSPSSAGDSTGSGFWPEVWTGSRYGSPPASGSGGRGSRDDTNDPERTGFERAGGYYVGYQPPVQLGSGAATAVWGSLLPRDGKTPDRNTGEMRTPWYWVPPAMAADQSIAVLIAGSPNQGNSLTADYGIVRGNRIIRIDPSTPPAAVGPTPPAPTPPASPAPIPPAPPGPPAPPHPHPPKTTAPPPPTPPTTPAPTPPNPNAPRPPPPPGGPEWG